MSVRNIFCQIYFRFVIKTYEPPDYTSTYIFSKTESFKLTFEISKYNISSRNKEIPRNLWYPKPDSSRCTQQATTCPHHQPQQPVPKPSHSGSWRTILILYYLGLGLQSGHFRSSFPPKPCIHLSLTRDTCVASLLLHDLNTRKIFDEDELRIHKIKSRDQ